MSGKYAKQSNTKKEVFRIILSLLWKIGVAYLGTVVFISILFRLFGLQPYLVVSNSMEPVFNKNTLVLVSINRLPIQKGDIIAFQSKWYNNKTVIHRYHDKTLDGIITKGDSNPVVDPSPLKEENIIGQVVGWSKILGIVMSYTIVISVGGMSILSYIFGTNTKKQKHRKH